MSYRTFFAFSAGLRKAIRVPKGTLAAIRAHVAHVESTLGLEVEQYLDNPPHWKTTAPRDGVTDEVLCAVASAHNEWVRWLYWNLGEWSQKRPAPPTEVLTVKHAQSFWHALRDITVPPARWTRGYYQARMNHLYAVMRGHENEGVDFGAKALTPRQAAKVVILFSTFLDKYDIRLAVPNGHDHLRSSYEGGWSWCEKCGPVASEDEESCRKTKCPLRAERGGP